MYTINGNNKKNGLNLDALSGFSLQKESILLGTMLGRQNPLCIPILVKYSGKKNNPSSIGWSFYAYYTSLYIPIMILVSCSSWSHDGYPDRMKNQVCSCCFFSPWTKHTRKCRGVEKPWWKWNPTGWGPSSLAKLVNITIITSWCMIRK